MKRLKAKTLDSFTQQMFAEHPLQGRPCTVPVPMGMQQRTKETQPQPSQSLSSSDKIHIIEK